MAVDDLVNARTSLAYRCRSAWQPILEPKDLGSTGEPAPLQVRIVQLLEHLQAGAESSLSRSHGRAPLWVRVVPQDICPKVQHEAALATARCLPLPVPALQPNFPAQWAPVRAYAAGTSGHPLSATRTASPSQKSSLLLRDCARCSYSSRPWHLLPLPFC